MQLPLSKFYVPSENAWHSAVKVLYTFNFDFEFRLLQQVKSKELYQNNSKSAGHSHIRSTSCKRASTQMRWFQPCLPALWCPT